MSHAISHVINLQRQDSVIKMRGVVCRGSLDSCYGPPEQQVILDSVSSDNAVKSACQQAI